MSIKCFFPRSPRTTQPSIAAMMADVLVALLPALIMGAFFFGPKVLILTGLSMGSCMLFEFLYRRATHQKNTLNDLSACVTGLLLAMTLPATSGYWTPVLGAAFAIVLVKQLYGGLGKNFVNPALAARMLLATFPVLMTNWSQPMEWVPLWGVDAVSAATPLSYLHAGQVPPHTLGQLLLGQQGGSMGEISAFMLLLGGLWLMMRRVISFRIPVSFLGTVAVLTFLFPAQGVSRLAWMAAELLSGGLMLGAFFLAPDPVTSPVTPRGQLLYGAGCGVLTVLLRYFSSYPEGVGWAILTMNCCVWLLDRAGMPRRFGEESFASLHRWRTRARRSVAEIQFVKPSFRFFKPADGKAPGEEQLDQIRVRAKGLACLCGAVLTMALIISGVHQLTDLNTAQAETKLQREILAKAMPQAASSSETPYRADNALSIRAAYCENHELLGYCVEVQAQGFSGTITMTVGVDLNGQVTGVAVTNHHESSSVGAKAMTSEALSRYVGESGALQNRVDVVTGATATSKAITSGVSRALAIVANLNPNNNIEYMDGEV